MYDEEKTENKHVEAQHWNAQMIVLRIALRLLLDLSSPASSESVRFLSKTGAGGLETRLTEAIGNQISVQYKSELTQAVNEALCCDRCWKMFRLQDNKKLTVFHVSTETVYRHSPLSYQ